MNTVAHARYEQHIKESLLSGKPVEYSVSDFMDNKGKNNKKNNVNVNLDPCEYNMKTVQEVVQHIEHLQACFDDDKKEFLKALLCSITGERYAFNQ